VSFTVIFSSFKQTFFHIPFSLSSPDVFWSESGSQRQLTRDESANVVTGEVQYTAPNGEVISYTYVADENGFQPSNLPQAQPLSPAIQRQLDHIAFVNSRNGQ